MPPENRSSNTEMVSLSRDLIDLTLAHLPNDSAAKWEIHEVLARPAPQPHPEPIAWMVGTAIWWTTEEAERDSVAMGLPIVGLGPMTDTSEIERLVAANTEYARRHLELQGEVERLRQEVASIDKKLRGNVSDPDPLKPIMPGALSVTTTYGLVAGIVRERDQLKKALERQPS